VKQRRLVRNARIAVSAGVVLFFIGVGIFASTIAPYDPLEMHSGASFHPMSIRFLLGTDEFGRDLLSRLIWGARISMQVATIGVVISTSIGVFLGLIAAYYGGILDTIIMRAMDVVMSFPTVVLALAIVAFLGSSITILMLTVGFLYLPGVVRVVYSTSLTIKHKEYVLAAHSIGASNPHIIRIAILPNIMGPLLVRITLNMGYAILLESGLGFLGLGAPPPQPSWGAMISVGRAYMEMQPLYIFWPALVVALAVLSFNTLGDGLRDILDPRLKEP
jgi:peptide/nickel transport system permease protein